MEEDVVKIGEFRVNKEVLDIIFSVRPKKRGRGRQKTKAEKKRYYPPTRKS